MRAPYPETRSDRASPPHRKTNKPEAEQEGCGGFRDGIDSSSLQIPVVAPDWAAILFNGLTIVEKHDVSAPCRSAHRLGEGVLHRTQRRKVDIKRWKGVVATRLAREVNTTWIIFVAVF